MSVHLEYVSCDLCGEDRTSLYCRKRGRQIPIMFNIVRCDNCGLYYVNPRIDVARSAEIYSDEYYNGKGLDGSFVGDSQGKRQDARLLVRSIREILKPNSRIRLLEVGGGEGLVSFEARNYGYESLMCDISKAAVSRARRKGIECFEGMITDPYFAAFANSFDVVVAIEVIEHLHSPKRFFAKVYELLKPGGLFIYTTGNVSATRFLRNRWGYFDIPEAHIYFFSQDTIRLYLQSCGFTTFVDPYTVYYRRNAGVRVLERIGLIDLEESCAPQSILERVLYSRLFKLLEGLLGRRRLPWAIK